MTAAVPDPRPCACSHSQTAHPVPTDCVRCTCTDYRPAVPDPRLRDQLAKLRAALIGDLPGAYPWHEIVDPWLAPDGAVGRLIAAEVEARVQAAANQRAEETVEPGLSAESNGRRLAWFTDDELAAELNRRGAAAPAAPAPEAPPCWCIACEHLTARARTEAGDPLAMFARRFIVCPDCGNKRCPKATHHNLACTGSNEPGQPGSAYVQTAALATSVQEIRDRILAETEPPGTGRHAGRPTRSSASQERPR